MHSESSGVALRSPLRRGTHGGNTTGDGNQTGAPGAVVVRAGQEEKPMVLKTPQMPHPTVASQEPVAAPAPAAESALPALPTFDLEVGWKYVYNPETGVHDQVPLTLLDVLYPLEDEAIVMPESPDHDLWTRWLATMLEGFLRGWLILSDVLIHPRR